MLMRDHVVLLARRAQHRTAYPDRWSFPGGHVEPGEALDAALIRECQEEIGITPVAFTPVGTIRDPNDEDPATYHMFSVTTWDGGEPVLIGDEHTSLRWFAPETAATLKELALGAYRPLLLALAGA